MWFMHRYHQPLRIISSSVVGLVVIDKNQSAVCFIVLLIRQPCCTCSISKISLRSKRETPQWSTSYPGHFASGKRKWPWHRLVTWPQNLQYLGCSIMIIYTYKYVYRIIIYILITDRSKLTQWCIYNQRESDKISWLYSVFVVYSSFSNIARNMTF
jgi:hypothetical protein